MIRINQGSFLITPILVFLTLCASTSGKIIYVDDDATGINDGTSWENAYIYLQDALADANSVEKPVQIRVAQGIYKPDQGNNQIPGDRKATFQLINGVAIKGGFAGNDTLDPNARDVVLYKTILSGDLLNNDGDATDLKELLFEFYDDNSFSVVTGSGTDDSAVLDGFTITAGNAHVPYRDNPYPDANNATAGGGMYNQSGHPTVIHCTFIRNSAGNGGGMYSLYGNPVLANCIFTANFASRMGAGMYNKKSNPTLNHCKFDKNSSLLHVSLSRYVDTGLSNDASYTMQSSYLYDRIGPHLDGGGMHNNQSNPMITNCMFSENQAGSGGGMYNSNSHLTLTSCVFFVNSAGYSGGGIANVNSSLMLLNCMFNRNSSSGTGGGMTSYQSITTLTNCTFNRNWAYYGGGGLDNDGRSDATLIGCLLVKNSCDNFGGGMGNSRESTATLINCTITGNSAMKVGGLINYKGNITNSILWDNSIPQITGNVVMSYSNFQGGWPGEGNIDVDPLFVNPGYWSDVNDPNIIVEPGDPNAVWVDGDYHLKSEAGRWNPVSESWVIDNVTSPCIDAGDPNSPVGDEPEPNGGRINMGAYGGTAEASMSPGVEQIVYVQWLGHSTVKVWTDDCVVYVDPERVPESLHDATLVCVTHTHGDHYSPADIAKVSNAQTQFIGPTDVVQRYGSGRTIAPGQTIEFEFVSVMAVPAYNTNKPNHPKSNNWVGYIIELGGKRIYVAGDTDLIEEMKSLGDIDVAFLPAGGTYTMNATEAAEATGYIKPDLAIPYHWGRNVGTLADAQTFVELAQCPAMVLAVGEMISSDNWPEYSPLIAHWALDEAEGDVAHDSAGENHGKISGEPVWQLPGGKIDGALQFDGIDDYVSTEFVLNPADGAFSTFAWIQGGAPRQVIISQADVLAGRSIKPGSIWLGVDPSDGKLMTGLGLVSAGSPIPPLPSLMSESIITDGDWHHVGVVITVNQSMRYRNLYLDGARVAMDTQSVELLSSNGGMYIGAGQNLGIGTFFSGLIDDVRIYNTALTAEEIGQLAN